MIFLPNNFSLYTAALRNYIQLSVIRHGLQPKHLSSMKKIFEAEALFSASCNDIEPLNIMEYYYRLLLSAKIKLAEKGRRLTCALDGGGIFLINRKLFAAVLLEIASKASKISLATKRGNIIIYAAGADFNRCMQLVKPLGGNGFYEIKAKTLLIVIPASKTNKKPLYTKKDWEDIRNPFSVINLYLM